MKLSLSLSLSLSVRALKLAVVLKRGRELKVTHRRGRSESGRETRRREKDRCENRAALPGSSTAPAGRAVRVLSVLSVPHGGPGGWPWVGRRGGGKRVFITHVKGTFLGMSESEEASKRR